MRWILRALIAFTICSATPLHAQFVPEWARSLVGPGNNSAKCVSTVAYSQTTYVAGNMNGAIDLSPSPGVGELTSIGNAAYLAEYNQIGHLVWWVVLNGSGTVEINDITSTQGVVVTGTFSGTLQCDPSNTAPALVADGGTDAFIASYWSDGTFRWAWSIGGLGNDEGRTLAMDEAANDVFFAGTFQDTVVLADAGSTFTAISNGGSDIMVGYFSPFGSPIWLKGFGGTNNETVASMDVGNQGVAMVGSYSGSMDADPGPGVVQLTSAGGTDTYYQFFDQYGSATSAWSYGGAGDDQGTAITYDMEYGWLLAMNFVGSISFDSGLSTMVAAGGSDIAVVCRNSGGYIYWAKQFGGAGADEAIGLSAQDFYHYALTGNFKDAALTTGVSIPNAGGSDMFIIRFDAEGEVEQSTPIGGPADEHCLDAVFDEAGRLTMCGDLHAELDVDPGSGVLAIPAPEPMDAFVVVFDAGTVLVGHHADHDRGAPFPNPASTAILLPLSMEDVVVEVSIHDAIGRLISTEQIRNTMGIARFDLSSLANGSYLFDLRFNDGSKRSFTVVVKK